MESLKALLESIKNSEPSENEITACKTYKIRIIQLIMDYKTLVDIMHGIVAANSSEDAHSHDGGDEQIFDKILEIEKLQTSNYPFDVLTETLTAYYAYGSYMMGLACKSSSFSTAIQLCDKIIENQTKGITYENTPLSVKIAIIKGIDETMLQDEVFKKYLNSSEEPNFNVYIDDQKPIIFAHYVKTMCLLQQYKMSENKREMDKDGIMLSLKNYKESIERFGEKRGNCGASHQKMCDLLQEHIDRCFETYN